jgi:hypothetical protein
MTFDQISDGVDTGAMSDQADSDDSDGVQEEEADPEQDVELLQAVLRIGILFFIRKVIPVSKWNFRF